MTEKPPKRIHIGSLQSMPERKPVERPFDPRTDISDEVISRIKMAYANLREARVESDIARLLFSDSQKNAQGLRLTDKPRPSLEEPITEEDNTVSFLCKAAHRKMFGEEVQISRERHEDIKAAIRDRGESKHYDNQAELSALYRICGGEVTTPDAAWPMLIQKFQERRDGGMNEFSESSLLLITSVASIMAADEVRIPAGGGLELIFHDTEQINDDDATSPPEKLNF